MANTILETLCIDGVCMDTPKAGSQFISDDKNATISTAGFGTYTSGATVTIPKGVWVITGTWIFPQGSTTGARNIGFRIQDTTNNESHREQRILTASANAIQILSTSAVVYLTASTTFTAQGASSLAINSAGRTTLAAMALA